MDAIVILLALIGLTAAAFIVFKLRKAILKSDCGSCCSSCCRTCGSVATKLDKGNDDK